MYNTISYNKLSVTKKFKDDGIVHLLPSNLVLTPETRPIANFRIFGLCYVVIHPFILSLSTYSTNKEHGCYSSITLMTTGNVDYNYNKIIPIIIQNVRTGKSTALRLLRESRRAKPRAGPELLHCTGQREKTVRSVQPKQEMVLKE